jgi:hypothetical protein
MQKRKPSPEQLDKPLWRRLQSGLFLPVRDPGTYLRSSIARRPPSRANWETAVTTSAAPAGNNGRKAQAGASASKICAAAHSGPMCFLFASGYHVQSCNGRTADFDSSKHRCLRRIKNDYNWNSHDCHEPQWPLEFESTIV